MEETLSNPMLSLNKRTLVTKAGSYVTRNQSLRSSVDTQANSRKVSINALEEGTEYISECQYTHMRRSSDSRFVFKSLHSKNASGQINLPSNSEIPLIEI